MAEPVDIIVRARDEASRVLQNVSRETSNLGKSTSSLGAQFDSAGTKVTNFGRNLTQHLRTLGLAVGAFAGINGLGIAGLVQLGAEAQRTSDKFATSFAPTIDQANRFITDLRKSTAYATSTLQDTDTAFGTIGKTLGLTSAQTETFGETFTKMALDMAAFANSTPEEVAQAIEVGLTGQTRGLKKFGIEITQQDIARKASLMGITGALNDQQKALVISQLLQEQYARSPAFGFLANNIHKPYVQITQLRENVKQLGQDVGKFLLLPLGAVGVGVNKWLVHTTASFEKYEKGVEDRAKTLGPSIGDAFKRGDLKGAASGLAAVLGNDKLADPINNLLHIGRDFANIWKNEVVPVGKDIAGYVVPALDGLRKVLDLIADHATTAKTLFEGFLAFEAAKKIADGISAITDAIKALTTAEAANASASTASGAAGAAGGAAGAAGGSVGLLPLLAGKKGSPGARGISQSPENGGEGGAIGDAAAGSLGLGALAPDVLGPVAILGTGSAISNYEKAQRAKKAAKKKHKSFWGSIFDPGTNKAWLGIGDTASPMSAHLRSGQYVTSNRRSFGLGSANSDHLSGRAFDIAGSGLGLTLASIRAGGGAGVLHGADTSRHLHAVPMGDTASPMGSAGTGGYGAPTFQTVINVLPGADTNNISRQTYDAHVQLMRRYEREQARRAPTG